MVLCGGLGGLSKNHGRFSWIRGRDVVGFSGNLAVLYCGVRPLGGQVFYIASIVSFAVCLRFFRPLKTQVLGVPGGYGRRDLRGGLVYLGLFLGFKVPLFRVGSGGDERQRTFLLANPVQIQGFHFCGRSAGNSFLLKKKPLGLLL